jgi:hypothetical protein
LLGNSNTEQLLKDYNGQTYWLSVNPASFIKKQNRFPKWLNIAFGYGANGMIGASQNATVFDKNGNSIVFKRYRQGYLSLDVDFTKVKTKSRVLNSILSFVNCVKIPFPNLELSQGKLTFNYY